MRVKLRRNTAAAWTAANPVLAAGEPAVETDTRKIKVGDGVTAWTSLGYSADPSASSGGGTGAAIGTSRALPDATAAAGAALTAAASDHVHPRAVIRASDLDGYRGWSTDPIYGTLGNSALSGGTIHVTAIPLDVDGPLSNLVMYVGTAATITTAGQCFAAIFDAAGNQLAVSADIGTLLTSTGKRVLPMAAATGARTAGEIVYGAILVNGTGTAPQFGRGSQPLAMIANKRNGAISGSAGSTTMPTSFAPNSLAAPTGAFWMAVT